MKLEIQIIKREGWYTSLVYDEKKNQVYCGPCRDVWFGKKEDAMLFADLTIRSRQIRSERPPNFMRLSDSDGGIIFTNGKASLKGKIYSLKNISEAPPIFRKKALELWGSVVVERLSLYY